MALFLVLFCFVLSFLIGLLIAILIFTLCGVLWEGCCVCFLWSFRGIVLKRLSLVSQASHIPYMRTGVGKGLVFSLTFPAWPLTLEQNTSQSPKVIIIADKGLLPLTLSN